MEQSTQTLFSLTGYQAPFLLQQSEKLVFNQEQRVLNLFRDEELIHQEKLSPLVARLFSCLLDYYPHCAPDELLMKNAIDIQIDAYDTTSGCLPLQRGITQLRKKLVSLGITIARWQTVGYVLVPHRPHRHAYAEMTNVYASSLPITRPQG